MSGAGDRDQLRTALHRAGRRAAFHLLRAGVETLKALEAVIDELARARSSGRETEQTGSTRITVE